MTRYTGITPKSMTNVRRQTSGKDDAESGQARGPSRRQLKTTLSQPSSPRRLPAVNEIMLREMRQDAELALVLDEWFTFLLRDGAPCVRTGNRTRRLRVCTFLALPAAPTHRPGLCSSTEFELDARRRRKAPAAMSARTPSHACSRSLTRCNHHLSSALKSPYSSALRPPVRPCQLVRPRRSPSSATSSPPSPPWCV